jgi:hypothetical protein
MSDWVGGVREYGVTVMRNRVTAVTSFDSNTSLSRVLVMTGYPQTAPSFVYKPTTRRQETKE